MISKKDSKETISKKNKKEENKKAPTANQGTTEDKTLDNDGRVGTMLKETRLQKGEDIEDISRKLHIRSNYLEAIENSRYDEVPEAPYGPGFVRSYADYLGLNAVRMSQLYKEETEAQSKKSDMYVPEPETEATAPSYKYILVSLIAIALAYGGWNYYISQMVPSVVEENAPTSASSAEDNGEFALQVEEIEEQEKGMAQVTSDSKEEKTDTKTVEDTNAISEKASEQQALKTEETAKVQPQEPITPKENTISEEKKEAKETVEEKVVEENQNAEIKTEPKAEEKKQEPIPAPASIDTDVKVVMKANQETWIEAKDSDKLYISKVVQAGYTYNVPDKEGMIISAGRYDAVDVYVNGKLTPVFTANKKTGIKVDEVLEQAEND